MREKRNIVCSESPQYKQKIIGFTSKSITYIIGALSTAIASISAYVSTPVGEYINNLIWEEKAEIRLISQNPLVHKGEEFNLNVIVFPQGPIPLSEGILEIQYPRDLLRRISKDDVMISTPKMSGATTVFEKPLSFIAENTGQADISAILKTKNMKQDLHSKPLQLRILPTSEHSYPTLENFSGTWNIVQGGINGRMVIKDVARTLSGQYTLSDGQLGQIDGFHDGTTFDVTFYRGTAPSRYSIHANFFKNEHDYIEIKGKSQLLIPSKKQKQTWEIASEIEFYATASSKP